ncbi:hypothetical protein ABIB73_006993 [Bradyrhizobium sp. F1.4.3]
MRQKGPGSLPASCSWMAGTNPAIVMFANYFASARFGGEAGHDLISVS